MTHQAPGRGGLGIDPSRTALLFIEFQNEFATEGGKLHPQVKEVMDSTAMLQNASQLAKDMRACGVKVFHAPITFAADGSDNPNKNLGILAGCDGDRLFTRGTWNAAICEAMTPAPEDVLVVGKRGLSAFPHSNLEEQLKLHNIETIALGGFMANCCVESTMREAFERGFNVVMLTDCVATTSVAGYRAAVDITYPFFSTPMNASSFKANIQETLALKEANCDGGERVAKKQKTVHPLPSWTVKNVAPDVYQIGSWFVDVRQGVQGDKIVLRSGEHELTRYLTFAEASGFPGRDGNCAICDSVYFKKRPLYTDAPGESTEPFGWFCNMTVVRLPGPEGGCLVYSPILDANNSVKNILEELTSHKLLPVRVVISPSPQHHLSLTAYQQEFPGAFFICGKASGQMQPLTKKRRDIRFDAVMAARAGGSGVVLGASIADNEGCQIADSRRAEVAKLLHEVFDVCLMDDNRTGEIVLRHKESKTLIVSDLLYKSNAEVLGPGGKRTRYSDPEWFAQGQEELFYGHTEDNSAGLLPSYRTHPRMRTIDIPGMRRSLDTILAWEIDRGLACHTDPIETGEEMKELLKQAWAWVFSDA